MNYCINQNIHNWLEMIQGYENSLDQEKKILQFLVIFMIVLDLQRIGTGSALTQETYYRS